MAVTRVSTDGLADSAVNSAKIGVDVITDTDLANNSVTANEISSNAVTSDKIAANAVTVNEIADLAVTHSKLHNTMDLSSKTVTLPSLANLSVTGTTTLSNTLSVSAGHGDILNVSSSDSGGTDFALRVDANEVSFKVDQGNNEADSVLTFDVDGTEHMRLDGSGNLGIGTTTPTVPVHVAPDGTYSKTTPFTLSGGKLYSNDIYTDYVYKWSGNATRTIDLLCNSYHMAEVTYTSHQTNGGSDIHRHIKGKWANNHTTHTWTPYTNTGDTWSIGLSISATDQSGSSSGSPNGRLRVRQTYGSGSYAYSTLTIRTYYDAFTGINISTS